MANSQLSLCAALALVPLAGCRRSEQPQPQQNAAAAAPVDDYQARLRTMAEATRNAVFIRAIRDAGFECQHVASSSEVSGGGEPAWSAVCNDTGQWIIAIGANGNAQVSRGAPPPPDEEPAAANGQGG